VEAIEWERWEARQFLKFQAKLIAQGETIQDRKFNRARSSIRRTYGAIADPARAGRRAAACPPPRLGGRPDGVARRHPVARGRIGRPGGTDAHTERPRA